MASWSIEMNVLNLAEKRVSVVGTRTDGETVQRFTIINTQFVPAHETLNTFKARVASTLYQLYLAAVDKQSSYANLVGTAEVDIATLLDGMET